MLGLERSTQPRYCFGVQERSTKSLAPRVAGAAQRPRYRCVSAVQQQTAAPQDYNSVIGGAMVGLLRGDYEQAYLATRSSKVCEVFPNSLEVDDFVHRLEIVLYSLGFSGENSIACTNLCRDEITATLKHKLDHVFGYSFNVNGLGGVLTSGVLGIGAGLSHSPIDGESGKERYVFFSFPHIAVSPHHEVGVLCRPGRPGKSSACGALCKALSDLKTEGLAANCKGPGVHEPENPEYSILKQRLARRLQQEGSTEKDIEAMDLVHLTKVAERVITADLEYLISKAVNPNKADYAVVAGVQIHSWGKEYDDDIPNLEYVQPCASYTVVNGHKQAFDLASIPALTPRQTRELAVARGEGKFADEGPAAMPTTPIIDSAYPYSGDRRALRDRAARFRDLLSHLQKAQNGA